jgi:hypothetical protein
MARTWRTLGIAIAAALAVFGLLRWTAGQRGEAPAIAPAASPAPSAPAAPSDAASPAEAEPPAAAPPAPAPASADEPPDGAERRAAAEKAGELPIASGETIEVQAASLTPGRPVALRLFLAEPSKSAGPLAARVLAPDGRIFESHAAPGADRRDVRVEVDPAFLRPGRYIVEVRTTEQTHFPVRRYALEVK